MEKTAMTKDKLREIIRCSLFNETDTEDVMNVIDAYLQTASQFKQPVGDGWVSVEDEKPIPYTTVLLCFKKESLGMNNVLKTGRWVGDSFVCDGDLPLLPTFVTHWQPLPSPPKP